MEESNQYQVILTINGKETPIASWEDHRAGDVTLELVRYAYKQMLSYLIDSDEKRQKVATNQPYCEDHHVPMTVRKSKYGDGVWYSCPHKNEDGTYCKYKPKRG